MRAKEGQTVYVVEFVLDESDGEWSEDEMRQAFIEIESKISEQGCEITRYIEPKE